MNILDVLRPPFFPKFDTEANAAALTIVCTMPDGASEANCATQAVRSAKRGSPRKVRVHLDPTATVEERQAAVEQIITEALLNPSGTKMRILAAMARAPDKEFTSQCFAELGVLAGNASTMLSRLAAANLIHATEKVRMKGRGRLCYCYLFGPTPSEMALDSRYERASPAGRQRIKESSRSRRRNGDLTTEVRPAPT